MSTNTKLAEQAAKAVPAGLYVGLIERLMRLSTRLGIADGDSVEHFAASLEDRLYAICRSAESLLDSLAPAAPAPEAQAAGQEQDERAAFEIWADNVFYNGLASVSDTWNDETGRYFDAAHFMAWKAWQARAALAQRREPLQDSTLWGMWVDSPSDVLAFARRIERHYGIGATTGEQQR